MTNTNQIVRNFPLSDVLKPKRTELPTLPWLGSFYTKKEVDKLIKEAVDEARRIDEESMRKHNRDATIISMILGFTTLALFVDGLLRLLGVTPPFMGIDIDILDKIVDKVESDLLPLVQKIPRI